MVTITKLIRTIEGKELVEMACLSTDTKPTNVWNGSLCLEMDTGKVYAFNGTALEWVELA